VSPTADAVVHALRTYADPVRATYDRKYHKSTREHWGITAPHLDAVIKPFVKHHSVPTLLQVAQELWHTQTFDLMIAAARILGQKHIPASEELWHLITTFLRDVDGWALEDTLAPAAWKCFLHQPAVLDEIERWTGHEQMWMRRAALIYTLPYAKPGYDPERILTWMGQYTSDPAWFI
jgi:3-methyladenine DNA glycosylase AlkD